MWEMSDRAERGRGSRDLSARLVEVSAVLEILVPPSVPSLYFWALQVDFVEDGVTWGGGHTGLQWNRRFPQNAAANWGGYASQARGGAVLLGSMPALPTFSGDPNTMAYGWRPGRPYRLRVYRSPEAPGAWRAEVTDVTAGEVMVLRDLYRAVNPSARSLSGASSEGYLRTPIVWSEVFADCDAPSVVVRWSDFRGENDDGRVIIPERVRVNYQSREDGGCANTTVRRDEVGLLQVTNHPRETEQGALLPCRGS
jgi:hypothetical protein